MRFSTQYCSGECRKADFDAGRAVFDLIRRSLRSNYFLHFAAHQEMLTAAKMALSAAG